MEWGRWGVLVATTWMQALTGTNLDFSAYSTQLKSVMQISQLQLSLLSMASDMGKVFGWCSGVSLLYFPVWLVVFLAAFLGLFGYGLQWLLISGFISLPYFLILHVFRDTNRATDFIAKEAHLRSLEDIRTSSDFVNLIRKDAID